MSRALRTGRVAVTGAGRKGEARQSGGWTSRRRDARRGWGASVFQGKVRGTGWMRKPWRASKATSS